MAYEHSEGSATGLGDASDDLLYTCFVIWIAIR